jgi:hypothetical protein
MVYVGFCAGILLTLGIVWQAGFAVVVLPEGFNYVLRTRNCLPSEGHPRALCIHVEEVPSGVRVLPAGGIVYTVADDHFCLASPLTGGLGFQRAECDLPESAWWLFPQRRRGNPQPGVFASVAFHTELDWSDWINRAAISAVDACGIERSTKLFVAFDMAFDAVAEEWTLEPRAVVPSSYEAGRVHCLARELERCYAELSPAYRSPSDSPSDWGPGWSRNWSVSEHNVLFLVINLN